MIKKWIAIFLSIFFYVMGFAQNGTVQGTLTEEQNGQKMGLPFANVFLEGTTYGGTSDFDGNYKFVAPAGTYVLIASFMGYETFKKSIEITPNGEISINVEMKPEGVAIEGVDVVAKVNRESEIALIMEQKNATLAVENIGARQLSTQGISNAGAAVTKITGIIKQDGGKSINVRGLGDRYNTTTLNGLPLPSNNTENKNIDLELFSTDIISHINVEKTYSSHLYGDFGGANVNIVSKRFSGEPFIELKAKVGTNTTLLGLNKYYLQNGPTVSGFYSSNEPNIDAINTRSAYGLETSWDPQSKNVNPDIEFGLSGGKTFNFKNNSKLNTFITLSYDNEKEYVEGVLRTVNGSDFALDDVSGDEYNYGTQTQGMLNLNYSTKNSELYFNSIVMNATQQQFNTVAGVLRDIGDEALRRHAQFEQNLIMVNQLLGDHKLSDKSTLNWGIAYNSLQSNMPDRWMLTFVKYDSLTNIGDFDSEAAGKNFRYYHAFNENELAGNISYDRLFGKSNNDSEYRGKISIGYSGRYKIRDFRSVQYNHAILPDGFKLIQSDIDNVDSYLNESNFLDGKFNIDPIEVVYTGKMLNNAVFTSLEYNISARLLMLLGVRVENINMEIACTSRETGNNELVNNFNKLSFLPSLSLKYSLSEKSNLRFAASRTYTLPQFQEMPLISFNQITTRVWGNPYIYPSTVYNLDLKWEIFPKSGHMYSATVFGKYIQDPINKLVANGTLNEYVNANTGDWAYLYGIELDARRDLFKWGATNKSKVYAAANLTLMETEQELNKTKVQEETNRYFSSNFMVDRERLQGAAPVIFNATLGYNYNWKEVNTLSSALVYNYVSDKVYAIGHSTLGNQITSAKHSLDFVVKTEFNHLGISFSAKNILKAGYERIQQNEEMDWVVKAHNSGVAFSLGLSYKFN